MQWLEQPTKVA